MKFLIAAWYEFLKNIRDVKMLAFIVVFPIVVSYVVGTSVQSFFKEYDGKAIEAAYVNKDGGTVGRAFDQFINADEIKERIMARPYAGIDEGRKALADGACTVLIYLPEGLSESAAQGMDAEIELEGGEDVQFVNALTSSFVSMFNANTASVKTGGKPLEYERTDATVRVDRTKGGTFPRLIDYYAILVLLQALVIGGIFGAHITARNYNSDIHIRNHALPVRPWVLLFGRIAGSVAYLLVASTATILFTKFVYGVDWSGNVPVMVFTLAAFSFVAVGLGVICGRLFKKTSTSITMIFILMFFFGTVSGSVSPRSSAIAYGFITPNYYAKELMFGTIYGYPDQVMIQSALMLIAFVAAICLAIIALTRRARYDNI